MGYKTILVHINDERRLPRLLEAAAMLARRDGSHVVGASVMPPIIVYPGAETSFAIPAIIEAHRDAYRAEEVRMKALFDAVLVAAAADGGFSTEWLSLDAGTRATAADVLLPEARAADIVVASQPDPDWPNSHMLDVPDQLATESGRPVLIVPNTGGGTPVARRVLVAWNRTREATRAVFDALPLLQHAGEVAVAWVAPENDDVEPGSNPSARLVAALARHGVTCAKPLTIQAAGSAGEALLAEAAARFDLVVMGCYGHSRLREFILGGATRHVLAKATIPVLMSH